MNAKQTLMSHVVIALFGLLSATAVQAGDVSGQWRGEFDTAIGPRTTQ
jgi:hypothetical protein